MTAKKKEIIEFMSKSGNIIRIIPPNRIEVIVKDKKEVKE
jgi:hypothetical protein